MTPDEMWDKYAKIAALMMSECADAFEVGNDASFTDTEFSEAVLVSLGLMLEMVRRDLGLTPDNIVAITQAIADKMKAAGG